MKFEKNVLHVVLACVFPFLFLTATAVAERKMVRRFSVYDLKTATQVRGLNALKRRQTVARRELPEQVGVRVGVRKRRVVKYVLRVNGKRVRKLRGRRRIARARRRGLGLSAEWEVRTGENVFVAYAIYKEDRRRKFERKKRKITVVGKPDSSPDPTPTVAPTVEPTQEPQPTATATPTAEPTPQPTATATPTAEPTPQPTATATPTAEPTPQPTATATPTAEPTPQPTATATPTAEPTPQPTATATPTTEPTPQPTATATPTAEPTPEPTATPQGEVCGAGVNKVLALPDSSIGLSGYCSVSGISSVYWQLISGPTSVSFSSPSALTPVVSGLSGSGVYQFRLTVEHSQGTTVDTMQVGVSNSVSGFVFTAAVRGPQNVVRGFPLYLDLELEQTAGDHDYVYVAVAGLPHGIDYSMPDWEKNCCDGGKRGWAPYDTLMHFTVASDVAPGSYPVTIQVSSGGVLRSVSHTITVQPVPADLAVTTVSSIPTIPRLAQWQHNMTHFGEMWCDAGQISLWEGSVWYYDGMRLYYQIADYTDNPYWADTCVPIVRDIYRPFVLDANGGIQGWRVFPHGLQMDYQRKTDSQSRNAALLMSQNSAFAGSGGGVPVYESRETAYLVHAYSIAEELGASEHEYLQRAVALALGHLDQIAVTQSEPKVKPFMIALTFEALIRYYEKTADPRIPAVLKRSADFLWEESGAWDEATQSFLYISDDFEGEDPAAPAPDLNLLIAPLFGWLYHKTGEDKYRQWGDKVFAGGVTEDFDGDTFYEGGACLGCTGKIFSQNYRWSIDYVQWRQSPPQ